jgi:predicted dehydrogenase
VTEAGYPILLRSSGATGTVTQGAYVRLTGSNGGAEVSAATGPIRVVKLGDAGYEEFDMGVDGSPFDDQMRHFIACCETGCECIAAAEDALALMKLYDAIYLSADEGREVKL